MLKLKIFFIFVIAAMLALTIRASMFENVIDAGIRIARDPWGAATLADAYFGFLTFYLWILYKEPGAWPRFIWLAAILLLGNIAMAGYVLLQIRKLKGQGGLETLIVKRP